MWVFSVEKRLKPDQPSLRERLTTSYSLFITVLLPHSTLSPRSESWERVVEGEGGRGGGWDIFNGLENFSGVLLRSPCVRTYEFGLYVKEKRKVFFVRVKILL